MRGLIKVLICQKFDTHDNSLQLWHHNDMKSKEINRNVAAVNNLRLKPVIYKARTEKQWARGGVVVNALRYKPAGRGFDSRWCYWNFSVT